MYAKYNKSLSFILSILTIFYFPATTFSCTRVLLNQPGQAILVGNNMDWYDEMHTNLIVYPEGIARNEKGFGNELKWKSKYGSVVATAYDSITTNGMNERGLAAHMLGLAGSDYGVRNESIPGLPILLWIQFYLDNFQTVAEAVHYTETQQFQIIGGEAPGLGALELHLAIEDASGDSAIIEYIDGKPHIYHGSQYKILTNEPSFDRQLENLKLYVGFGGDKPLPGSTLPKDRFVRASYYTSYLPESKSTREAVLRLMSVMENAGQPFGTFSPDRAEDGHIYESLWRSVSDLTHHIFYFNSTMSFNIIWVQLDKFNLLPGSRVMKLELAINPDRVGDVTREFKAID